MTRFKVLLCVVLLSVSSLASAKTIEIEVNGLVCAFCAQGIEKTFKGFPATEAIFISLEHHIVAVQLKAGADIEDAAIQEAMTDAGYSIVAIHRTEESLDAIRRRVETDGSPR